MGGSPQPLFVSLDFRGNKEGRCNSSGPLWGKDLEAHQAKRRWQGRKRRVTAGIKGHIKISKSRSRRILMKRRARLEGSRRPANRIERKVRTLKKLIPNSESMGLDGLFSETADYILALQIRVKVMQIMVNVLSK
uniref:BHLH domain-containing protein n=1 Tax=Davidia involucrata TaxID=16924 RepID=A0A5B7BQN7_DAVIN